MVEELQKPTKLYFRNLDSIRFFAALMVFLSHTMFGRYRIPKIQGTIVERFLYGISNGEMGVTLFFVLSGFLITYLILSEQELTGNFSIKNFYIRRILRIWPLYFAVIAVTFLLFPLLSKMLKQPINHGANIFYQLTFLSNFDVMRIEKFRPGTEIMMQDITWSVAIEEQFYAFWPLIFFFLPRKFILPAICSVVTGSLLFRFYYANDRFTLYFNTLAVMSDLGIGALFAYFIISSKKVRNFFQQSTIYMTLFSFLLFFISLMYYDELQSTAIGKYLYHPYFDLLFGFIIASQSMIIITSKLQLGNIGFARKLGKYTYGIYLLHPIALEIIHVIGKAFHLSKNSFFTFSLAGVSGFALTLFISWLSYEYFEKKFLNLKKSFSFIIKE
jgi:peptidoglycan/LPS O-acetylase OafA/YrhL